MSFSGGGGRICHLFNLLVLVMEEKILTRGGDRSKIRVVVPGAGLGRLAFDIAVAGMEIIFSLYLVH